MEPDIIAIAIAGGFLAGFVNTLAGNGSAVTLTILSEVIGLPGNIANGTNRIGILAQTLFSAPFFLKHNQTALRKGKRIILWIILGSLLGIWIATIVSNDQFKTIFSYLMILILGIVLIKPKRWLMSSDMNYALPVFLEMIVYLGIGFYAGFIQMGMGVIFLVVTVLIAKYDLIDANAIKNIAVLFLTIVAIVIFHMQGMLDWKIGLTIAVGQASGGWVAARFATQNPKANVWAYRLLIVVILFGLVKLFGLHEYFLLGFNIMVK